MVEVTSLAGAAVASWLWCRALPTVGEVLGYVDEPGVDSLKIHRTAAVPLAGPGLFVGALVVTVIAGDLDLSLLAGLTAVTAVGVVDDRWDLAPATRLAVEVGGAALLASRWLDHGWGYFIFGLGIIVVGINAVNLYDGIDLLAASTGLAGLTLIGGLASIGTGSPWLAWGLAAAIAGFLPFNRPPARVFLGDGGAYLLGAVTAVAIVDVASTSSWPGAVAHLALFGMFGVDLGVTFLRRVRAGKRLFEGDRGHVYDRLLQSGIGLPAVVTRLVAMHIGTLAVAGLSILVLAPVAALVACAAVAAAAAATGWRWTAIPQ